METYTKDWFKFIVGFIACLLVRLIPFRPPNIEPILATQMPFSKKYGALAGFSFAFLSIVLYDLITAKVGMWTFVTAGTYGVLGLWAYFFFRKRKMEKLNYVKFAIIGTLFFDAVTGLSVGPLFFGQSFSEAFFGQIPFTAIHLIGNVSFALVLSPLIYKFVIENRKLESVSIINVLNFKS
ncbi:MAG: hypothetical protein KBC12_00565 [Candidatus Pacebacteria bacterium]|nr:hypothetical protein [Candidatus Paceibacterota bacterium]MBP9851145.1 hypothetical protein [Candidatus Paceibacterota bacterium]